MKYCTNQVGVILERKEWGVGINNINIGSGKAKAYKPVVQKNYFILIELKNGKKYLITPRNIDNFLKTFQQRTI